MHKFPARSSAMPIGSASCTFCRGAQRPATLRIIPGSVLAGPATMRIVALPVSEMYIVPSAATATPLRTVMSAVFKSSCAEAAAPPSPTEPIVPMPATAAMSFAALTAAADAELELAGTRNEKTLSGLSVDVTKSCSGDVAALVAVDAELSLARTSADGGAAVRVRTPMFEATMVGAIPFDAAGVVAAAEVVDGVAAGVEALCVCGWLCARALEAGFSSAMLSASAAKIVTTNAHKILSPRTQLSLNCSSYRTSHRSSNATLHVTSHNRRWLASTLLDSSAGVRVASRTDHHNSDSQDVNRERGRSWQIAPGRRRPHRQQNPGGNMALTLFYARTSGLDANGNVVFSVSALASAAQITPGAPTSLTVTVK